MSKLVIESPVKLPPLRFGFHTPSKKTSFNKDFFAKYSDIGKEDMPVSIHKRYLSEMPELKSEIASPVSASLTQAFKRIKPEETRRRINRPSLRHASTIISRGMRTEDTDINSFIQALFVHGPSPFRRAIFQNKKEQIDARTADKLLQEAKKIIKNGIKKKSKGKGLKDNLDEFWYSYISKSDLIRWDLFEESFFVFLDTYMQCDTGTIRKVNWALFFKKLYKDLADYCEDYSLWPPSVSYPNPPVHREKMVNKSHFASAVHRGNLTRALKASLQETTSYLNSLKTNTDYKYADSSVYSGQWKSGKKEGTGTLSLPSGDTYKGLFTKGLREDFGLFWGSGYTYKGDWRKDKYNGYGELTFPDGSVYKGLWNKGEMVSGKLEWSDHVYSGEWKHFKFDGPGKLTLPSGEIQEGYWKQGQLFGEAKIQKPNGTKYIGMMKDGLIHGEGQIFTDTYEYEGNLEKSLPHLNGRMVWKNGDIYEGNFHEGICHGKGMLERDGTVYEGDFVNGQRTGNAFITFPDGITYEGNVEKGELNGHGKFVYPESNELESYDGGVLNAKYERKGLLRYRNGHSYEGEFKDGLFDGTGVLKAGPETYSGSFSEGLFHGPGNWNHGLAYYKGVWYLGVPDGRGECKDFNGERFTGVFNNGHPVGRHKLQSSFIDLLYKRK